MCKNRRDQKRGGMRICSCRCTNRACNCKTSPGGQWSQPQGLPASCRFTSHRRPLRCHLPHRRCKSQPCRRQRGTCGQCEEIMSELAGCDTMASENWPDRGKLYSTLDRKVSPVCAHYPRDVLIEKYIHYAQKCMYHAEYIYRYMYPWACAWTFVFS